MRFGFPGHVGSALALLAATLPLVALGADVANAPATSAPTDFVAQAPLEEVLVTGVQTGPGLWKLTHPADRGEHVLWILGLQGPLPKKMKWRSVELEEAVAASQELLAPAEVDADVGILGRLTVLPSLVGARNNPNGRMLQDVVPPELYARWLVLKARYLGDAGQVEKWRPLFAAYELYRKAISKAGLERSDELLPIVTRLARKRGLKVTTPQIRLKVEQPRTAIKQFKREPLDDLECFAKTLARLESDLELMRARANAWATGNLAALRAMTPVGQASACIAAVMNAQVLQERGFADLPARLAAVWIAAAERAIEQNASTVAVLPMREIFEPEGLVAQLRARGYTVQDPD
jgi:hypothetical protein